MHSNKKRFTELIAFLAITVFSSLAPADAAENLQNRPPDSFYRIAENSQVNSDASSIDELNKVNSTLKKDVSLLGQQVNNLSNELNAMKTGTEGPVDIQKFMQDNWDAVSVVLATILLLLLLLSLLIYAKLRSDTRRTIQTDLEKMISSTKTEILKDFKINETEFNNYISQSSARSLETFNQSLEGNYSDLSQRLRETLDREMAEFQENVEHLIKRRLDKFSFELESQFEENKTNLLEQVQNQLPAGDLNAVILKLAEDKGLFNNMTAHLENNLNDLLNQEAEKLEKQLANKEKQIIADIQRVHLANNHFNIGNIMVKNKNYGEAVDEFREAIHIDPNFYGAYINLGKAYENEEQFNEAIEVYKQAIQVRPEHYKSYFNLGNLLNRLGMYENALEVYKNAIELRPDYPKLYNNIGITYQMLNRFNEAKESYEKAIELNNEYADAYLNLSKVEAMLEKNEDIFSIAEKHMKKHNASRETFSTVKELVVLQK